MLGIHGCCRAFAPQRGGRQAAPAQAARCGALDPASREGDKAPPPSPERAKRPKPVKLRAVRGMNDILPDEIRGWHRVERAFQRVAERYGYEEVRTPLIENTALFE